MEPNLKPYAVSQGIPGASEMSTDAQKNAILSLLAGPTNPHSYAVSVWYISWGWHQISPSCAGFGTELDAGTSSAAFKTCLGTDADPQPGFVAAMVCLLA